MILIGSILLFVNALTAQAPGYSTASERDRAGSYVGPFVGAVSAQVSGLSDSRLDMSTGVQLDRVFATGAFLRSGVFYSGRGGATSNSSVDVDFVTRYVELPLLVGYRLPDAVRTRVFVMGGGQLGVRTGCKYQGQANGISQDRQCDELVGSSYETFDLGLLAGGGISVALGGANLVLDVRLIQGLRNVEQGSDTRNRGVTIGAAYMLPLRHHN